MRTEDRRDVHARFTTASAAAARAADSSRPTHDVRREEGWGWLCGGGRHARITKRPRYRRPTRRASHSRCKAMWVAERQHAASPPRAVRSTRTRRARAARAAVTTLAKLPVSIITMAMRRKLEAPSAWQKICVASG